MDLRQVSRLSADGGCGVVGAPCCAEIVRLGKSPDRRLARATMVRTLVMPRARPHDNTEGFMACPPTNEPTPNQDLISGDARQCSSRTPNISRVGLSCQRSSTSAGRVHGIAERKYDKHENTNKYGDTDS